LRNRAYEIFNEKRDIVTQDIEESKTRYNNMTNIEIEDFISKNFITQGITEDVGTSFIWILSFWNSTMKNKISSKSLTQKLEDIGHEKKIRNWVYRTNEHNVFTEIGNIDESKTQQTVVMGLKPILLTKTAVLKGTIV